MCDEREEAAACTKATNYRLLYEQGSECCRTYSQLTMRVRTLAQQVMLAYVVGIGLILTRGTTGNGDEGDATALVLFIAGIVLSLFSTVLWALNQHYSIAFTRIRNESLRPIEQELLKPNETLRGPWESHAFKRPEWLRVASWHWPYVVLILVSLLTMIVGIAR